MRPPVVHRNRGGLVGVRGFKQNVSQPRGVAVLKVEGFDWNCPQHITPRFTEDEVRASVAPLLARLEALEKENAELRARSPVVPP